MILGAQTVPHNDGVTVQQCAIEGSQVKNAAQALGFGVEPLQIIKPNS